MSLPQVITFHKDGSVSGLQRKGEKNIDLRQFGRASIKRTSEISWDEEKQKFFVQFLDLNPPQPLTLSLYRRVHGVEYIKTDDHKPVYFDSYKAAETAEIEVLDYLRVRNLL